MKTKNLVLMTVATLMLLCLIGDVHAEEIPTTPDVQFDFGDWFAYHFGGFFSVVGDARICGEGVDHDPTLSFEYAQGELMNLNSGYCDSGSGFWNIFLEWSPWLETKDTAYFYCGSETCHVQLYCCPHPEPTSSSQCADWHGSYSQKETITCSLWYNPPLGIEKYTVLGTPYRCEGANGELEQDIPAIFSSYSYCTQAFGVTCYYYSGSGSSCTEKIYPGEITCPASYQGRILYEDEDDCEDNIPPSQYCGDDICNNGETCSSCSEDCGNCGGSCASEGQGCEYNGKDCCSGLTCTSFVCINPSSIVCGNGACQYGETFTNCPQDCGSAPVCGDGNCEAGETVGATYYCLEDCGSSVDCGNGICEDGETLGQDGYCIQDCYLRTEPDEGSSGGGSSAEKINKYPLTKEEISKSTTADLITASCYSKSECGTRKDNNGKDYSVSCIPISTLVKEGTLTTQTEKDLFSSAKGVIAAGAVGAGAGITICVASLATGPGALIGCGVGGALLAIGGIEGVSQLGIGISSLFSDELTKAIESGDSSKVGICTAESGFDYCKYTEWAGVFDFMKNKCQSGLITIIVLALILIIFLRGKK